MTRRALLLSLAAVLLALSCSVAPQEKPTRVLFIGNSYTYANNLPEVFAALARAGHRTVETRMVAPGGWRLKDHWDKGEAHNALRQGRWDYVVLQDQSTLGIVYFLEGKVHVTSDAVFNPYAEKWATEIRTAGAVPVFYVTWARKASPEDQQALNYAYMRAAKDTHALVAPVGMAWGRVRQQSPAVELFAPDGSHPSPAGTYLAACALYAALFRRTPEGLPSEVSGTAIDLASGDMGKTAVLVDLPSSVARQLQSAAWAAAQELATHGGYLDISPVAPPALPPLPPGLPLAAADLEGTWRGKILFYPVGPVDMALELHHQDNGWRGRLNIAYHNKDFADESFDLGDLKLGEREITFSDPKSVGVDNLPIAFRGLSPRAGELRGTAETVTQATEFPARLLGTWQLQKP